MTDTAVAPKPQHIASLEVANRIRLDRAEIKRDIFAGRTLVGELLENVPEAIASMKIGALLKSQYRWGSVRVRSFLAPFSISEDRRVGDLTPRQRHILVCKLRDGKPPSEAVKKLSPLHLQKQIDALRVIVSESHLDIADLMDRARREGIKGDSARARWVRELLLTAGVTKHAR